MKKLTKTRHVARPSDSPGRGAESGAQGCNRRAHRCRARAQSQQWRSRRSRPSEFPRPKRTSPPPVKPSSMPWIDIGFGNTLRILRGDGPRPELEQVGIQLGIARAAHHWKISLGQTAKPITFKFLINDETWRACGAGLCDWEPGGEVHLTPRF